MTASAALSSFDLLDGPIDDHVLAAASALAGRAADDPGQGVVVVIVRPYDDDHRVVSGGGSGVLRAAVSVAVAAGNDRLWRDAPDGTTWDVPLSAMPEVIAAATDSDGVRGAHVGRVVAGSRVEAVVIWFETRHGVATPSERDDALAALQAAGVVEQSRRAQYTAVVTADAVEEPPAAERTFDPSDPELDPVTGVRTADRLQEAIDEYERDEALLLVVDLDGFAPIAADIGCDTSDRVLRIVADRLVGNCRQTDLVSRTGHSRFVVLFDEVSRSDAMAIAKRIVAGVAEPLPGGLGLHNLTATVALCHQTGLVDVEEMLDSAISALGSSQRAGGGRLVLAA